MSDHFRYRQDQVEALLPACWDNDFGILAGKAEQARSTKGDPALGGDLAAMTADVRRAYRLLPKWDCELLHARFHHGLEFAAIAVLAGYESANEAAEDCDAALAYLIEYMNGRKASE